MPIGDRTRRPPLGGQDMPWHRQPQIGRRGGGQHGLAVQRKRARTKGGGGGGAQFPAFGGSGFGTGGFGGGGKTQGSPALELKADPSPQLQESRRRFEQQMNRLQQQAQKRDENLDFQIQQYKDRLGEGPTTRAIERSASAVRDQLAGLTAGAERQAAMTGRGEGFGQSGLADAAQRYQAGAAADIALGRERDLDRLTIAGQGIMAAPGQREMGYDQMASQFYGMNPYLQQAQHGLAEKGLGLQAYLGQGDLGLRELEAQARLYGTPMDWMRTMFPGGPMAMF